MLTLGWMGAVCLYALALLCAITIIGIPFAGVLVLVANRWFALRL
jgi:uncharacterized membrane protein YccF (DUF307 family)